MSAKEELREQFVAAFEGADYPVDDPMDLLPALPDGPSTKFSADDVTLTAMDLATNLGDKANFPYDTVDALVDDVISSLEDENYL
ncbi:MTH865 family protein [Halanaeroarchaeum sulfurireducens]|uniref:MTH865-like family protein n=1 Tax=Halanaeroarchaeum sulfurireducens TaxID=1604004 RepID=A0A0F7PCF0_9EURY|nr:MTH865 family protein [Halanaeroarchaeum sulfurireducens]AKH97319.1 hypothetical protein HLASF_0825 [Halanaeroarchaeum sulfurireducens]ALG81721.1 hypothetical protein HLASA_0822 [Halanaeroarchaeum sulfurireducens]